MKVEIEIPDIEELYFSEYEGEEISGKDFKKRIVSIAIEKFIISSNSSILSKYISHSSQKYLTSFILISPFK